MCGAGTSAYLSATAADVQPSGFPISLRGFVGANCEADRATTLPKSTSTTLLKLMKISKVDCSASPVARSYGGYPWEGVMPRPLHPDCNVATGDCSIIVDETQAAQYEWRVDAVERDRDRRSLTEADGVSKLFMQGSFGPTAATIEQAVAAAGKQSSSVLVDGDDSTAA
eukprot:gene21599-7851_t